MGVEGLEKKLQQVHDQGNLDWRRWDVVSDILHMTFLAKFRPYRRPHRILCAMLMFIDRADINPNDPYDVSKDKLVFGQGIILRQHMLPWPIFSSATSMMRSSPTSGASRMSSRAM